MKINFKNIAVTLFIIAVVVLPVWFRKELRIFFNVGLGDWIGYAGAVAGALIGGIFIIRLSGNERDKRFEEEKIKENFAKRNLINLSISRNQSFIPSLENEFVGCEYFLLTDLYKKYFFKFYNYYKNNHEDIEKKKEEILNIIHLLEKNENKKYLLDGNLFKYKMKNENQDDIFLIKDAEGNINYFNLTNNLFIEVDFLLINNIGNSDFLRNIIIKVEGKKFRKNKYSNFLEKLELFSWEKNKRIAIPLINEDIGDILIEKIIVEYTTQSGERNKVEYKNIDNSFNNNFEIVREEILESKPNVSLSNNFIEKGFSTKYEKLFHKKTVIEM